MRLAEAVLLLGADIAGLGRLYPWLEEQAAGLPDTLRHAMHVALEEAVVNVAMHGAPTAIRVRLALEATAAVLVVEDDGPAFDPVAAPGAGPREGPGGAGLKLLRHFCRDMGYVRDGGMNRLTLRFGR